MRRYLSAAKVGKEQRTDRPVILYNKYRFYFSGHLPEIGPGPEPEDHSRESLMKRKDSDIDDRYSTCVIVTLVHGLTLLTTLSTYIDFSFNL